MSWPINLSLKSLITIMRLTNRLDSFFKENDEIIIRGWPIHTKADPQAATGGALLKKVFLKISQISQENTPLLECLFNLY